MISILRASIRLVLFFLLSLLTVLVVALGNLFLGVFSKSLAVRWKNIIIKFWANSTKFIIGMKVDLKGIPPEPPFFLVSNHLSYIDVLPLWGHLSATFIAKSEIKSWPFFGWGTRTLGVLFIDREQKKDVHRMNNRIANVISDRQGVILFPEGTSSKGEQVLPFNSSLLEYPATTNMPVSYVSITYHSFDNSRPAHKNICWWGDMPFFSHFWQLLKIPSFEATVTFGNTQIADRDRKQLAQKLHTVVSDSFISVFSKRSEVSSDI